MKDQKKIILIGFCIIIVVIVILLCRNSFLKLIKLKNILNELDGKTATIQNSDNIYLLNSSDNNKTIQINLSNKFKKLSNFNYSDNFFKYNVTLSLDGQTPIGSITIGQNSKTVSEFNSSDTNRITYNNKSYIISSLTTIEALFTKDFPFALTTPIDSEYYYTIMFSSDNDFHNIEKEDLESLLNFKVIK